MICIPGLELSLPSFIFSFCYSATQSPTPIKYPIVFNFKNMISGLFITLVRFHKACNLKNERPQNEDVVTDLVMTEFLHKAVYRQQSSRALRGRLQWAGRKALPRSQSDPRPLRRDLEISGLVWVSRTSPFCVSGRALLSLFPESIYNPSR